MAAVVPFLVMMLVLGASSTLAWPPWKHHMSVNIINNVGEDISVHCKSGDSDLGRHTVHPGFSYGFGFYPNFWGSTKFWCTFNWGGKWQRFTVWSDIGPFPGEKSRKRPCDQCVYDVRGVEGFLRSEGEAGPFTKVQDWRYPLEFKQSLETKLHSSKSPDTLLWHIMP